MFDGFETRRVDTGAASIHLRIGGSGPAVLLLHGFPQTHVAWHRVAPRLAERFTVIAPDLRGYGDSRGPTRCDDDPLAYSKRSMAADMVAVLDSLGIDAAAVAGHDRGGRVGYRLALDHPGRVRRLALLDIATTLDTWDGFDRAAALASYHWPLLAQPKPLPERLIGADPHFYLHHLLDRWAGSPGVLAPDAVRAYEAAFERPPVIEAHCADYRAGATVDVAHDRADRAAGRRLPGPLLVLWAERYLADSPGPAWQRWCDDVRTVALDCGHFIAEEQPTACAAALGDFFAAA